MDVSRETCLADVSRETSERLQAYVDLLIVWNAKINLIGSVSTAELWSRHICDALRVVPLIPKSVQEAIDLGSGAGLPGLAVAIATGIHLHLVEADHRKAAFLREAARITAAPATIHATRIEHCRCAPARLVLSRALAPLPRLLALAHPMLAPGGICLFHKGRNVETELAAARKHWTMVADTFPSALDPSSVILRLSKVARV